MEPLPNDATPARPAGREPFPARIGWLLAVVIALAAFLRIRLALHSPLWFEELYIVLVARHTAAGVADIAARDIHPPVAFLMRHVWERIGDGSAMWQKWLSVLLAMLTFPVAFRLLKRLFDARVAVLATAFMAVAFALVRYGQEVGMFQLQWLLALLLVDTWTRWLDEGRARDAVLGCAVTLVAFYSHYVFLPVQALLFVWGLMELKHDGRRRALWLGLNAIAVVGFLPQLPTLLSQLAREGTMRYASFPHPDGFGEFARFLCLNHRPVLVAFIAFALVPLFDRARRHAAVLMWLLVVLPPFAIRVLPLTFPTEFLFAAPFWFALVAAGFDGRPLRAVRLALAVAIVVFSAVTCYRTPPFHEGLALRESLGRLRAMRQPGDFVLHAETHSLLFSLYYDPAGRNRLLLGSAGTTYFDGGLVIPDSVRMTQEAWAAERARGAAWWALTVDRARVSRNVVTRAGAEQVHAIAGAARGPHWLAPPVTLWEGQPPRPH